MKNQKQKEYEAPQTTYLEVELEQGFMKASVFVDKEDSEALTIDNQVRGEEFDFSGNTWDE
jgi:hypothetical protein BACCOPRO_03206